MKRVLSLTAAAALAAGTVVSVVAVAAPASAAVASPGAYVPITPVRAFDTREDRDAPALGGNVMRTVDLSREVDSTSATAVVVNLTVTAPTTGGYLTLYPAGATRPLASSINFRAGETRSNNVTVALPLGASVDKAINVYNQNGSTQVIIDVLGYYDPNRIQTSSGNYYVPTTPFRAFDSRTSGGPLAAGASRTITLPAPGSDVDRVTSVAVNLTAVNPTGPGYLRASNGVGPRPLVSSVNYGSDPVTPNFAIVPAVQAQNGTISFVVDNNVSTTDALVDVVGYYTNVLSTNGYLYNPVTPTRVDDTRDAGESPIGQNQTRDYPLDTLPFGVAAVNLNVTAVDATQPTYLTAYPTGVARPVASNLNPFTPNPLANAVQTGIGAADDTTAAGFTIYNQAGTVNVIVDLQGYFTPLD